VIEPRDCLEHEVYLGTVDGERHWLRRSRPGHPRPWVALNEPFGGSELWAVPDLAVSRLMAVRTHSSVANTTRNPADVIDRVADALGEHPEAFNVTDITDEQTTIIETSVEDIARFLYERGLLAPAPLREEWGPGDDGEAWRCCGDDNEAMVRYDAEVNGHQVFHRYATDWLPADAVNRAEGDGMAVNHE
jgi:hypothetical protein